MTKDEMMAVMKSHQGIIITYVNETTDDGQILTRRIYPMVLGYTKKGNLAVRAYQDFGASHHAPLGWRIFLLKNIKEWQFKGNFPTTPPADYRQNGDDDLNVIYQVTYPLTETIDKPISSAPSNEISTGSILQPLLVWWKKWRNKAKKG